ncbi:MAG: penicillin-binding transpeptidase domain-containing protein [Desulfobacterales bacterium]|jgi:cell division protein FtsI/penicillin-binding protein 2
MIYKHPYPSKWRRYQAKLHKAEKRRRFLKKLPSLLTISGVSCAVLVLLIFIGFWVSNLLSQLPQTAPQLQKKIEAHPTTPSENDLKKQISTRPAKSFRKDLKKQINTRPTKPSKKDLKVYLGNVVKDSARLTDQFILQNNGKRFFIRTTIHAKLQEYIGRMLKRSRTVQSAVVVLNPHDGRIKAMVNYNADGNSDNLCLKANFPAASLFKIVSASAALESAGYTPDKPLFFQGNKHTLYKYQLKTQKGRSTTQTKFRRAFASSNNSVFGKIGIYDLGQNVLVKYADKFYFNRRIPFEFPLAASRIDVPADEFGLAEIASGFNKRTLISPLHAALLSSVAANNGSMPMPWLVESVRNESNEILYQARQRVLETTVNQKTAADLKILMEDAVKYGTSRKSLRKLRRKEKFKNVDLGSKTGTINDSTDRYKYDWLTAFALSAADDRDICVGVLAVHGKILGTRANEMARAIINYYFSSKNA